MINIAELLKDAPEGTELWFTLYGKVKFMSVNFYETYPIQIRLNDNTVEKLDKYGRFFDHYEDAECVLFPSKDCRTWEGWKAPIESNFKVGDWVVFNNSHNSIYQISEISDSYYVLTHTQGGSMSLPFSQEKLIRPWTINDAQDGDVLVSRSNNPFIYNGNIEFSSVGAYIGISQNGKITLEMFPSKVWTNMKGVKPATKEQYDLLFTKIREAGYEWDADKKELRKTQHHYDISNFHAGMPVLVRDYFDEEWHYVQFSHMRKLTHALVFNAGCSDWYQCIPFNEKTKHLLGTTDMPSEEYINW